MNAGLFAPGRRYAPLRYSVAPKACTPMIKNQAGRNAGLSHAHSAGRWKVSRYGLVRVLVSHLGLIAVSVPVQKIPEARRDFRPEKGCERKAIGQLPHGL